MLARKLRRELWWQKSQILAITIALAIAVCCYVASRNSYLDLTNSYASLQEDLKLADWTLGVSDVDAKGLEKVRDVPGVLQAEDRIVVSLPLIVPKGRLAPDKVDRVRLEGRFITLTPGQKPEVNQLLIETGAYPLKPNEVLVEKHFAEHHRLKPGDELELEIPGAPRNQRLIVSGVAVSAEYLWVSRNELDIMPSPVSFGVLWIDGDALRKYRKRPAIYRLIRGGRNEDDKPRPKVKIEDQHEILLRLNEGQDDSTVLEAVKNAITPETVLTTTARDDLPQTEILRTDMKSLKGFSIFFPALFLVVGGSIIAVSLSRVIDSQRSLIGTMLAFGVPRYRILLHYLAFTLVVGGLGSLIGIASGIAVGKILTRAYAEVANVPRLTFLLHEGVLFFGALFGLLAAMVAGLLPACRAAAMYPAQAMRPPAPVLSRGIKGLRRLGASWPLPLRMAFRNLVRRPGRSLASTLGVAAALVLVLAGAGVVDGLNRTVHVLLSEAWQYDVRVDFFNSDQEGSLRTAVDPSGQLGELEMLLTVPASIQFENIQRETVVEGIPPDSRLLKPMDAQAGEVRPTEGVILPLALARQLNVKAGDTVEIRPLSGGPTVNLHVEAVTQGFGAEVFMRLNDAQEKFATSGQVNSVLIKTDSPGWQVRQSLQSLSKVARVQDMQDLRERVTSMMDFNYLLVGFMLLFSAILGTAILFTTSTLNILERRRELATMRTLGLPFPQIASMVTLEHGLLGILGIAVGIPSGLWAMRQALNLYENDFLTLPLVLEPATFALAIGNLFLVLLLAQWPVLRSIVRQNLADIVREREQG